MACYSKCADPSHDQERNAYPDHAACHSCNTVLYQIGTRKNADFSFFCKPKAITDCCRTQKGKQLCPKSPDSRIFILWCCEHADKQCPSNHKQECFQYRKSQFFHNSFLLSFLAATLFDNEVLCFPCWRWLRAFRHHLTDGTSSPHSGH